MRTGRFRKVNNSSKATHNDERAAWDPRRVCFTAGCGLYHLGAAQDDMEESEPLRQDAWVELEVHLQDPLFLSNP